MSEERVFHILETLTMLGLGTPTVWFLIKVVALLKEFGLHRHQEEKGPLHAEGIFKAKTLNGGN